MSDFEYKKDPEQCVCVNVFVKCGKKDGCDKEQWEAKDCNQDDCCVSVNIFAECKKNDRKKDDCGKDNCCVEINIFADCDRKH